MQLVLTCLLLAFSRQAFSQPPTDWNAFSQKQDVSAYRGMKFKVEAAVRMEAIDANAEAELFVRIDNADQSRGFFDNMTDRPIRKKEWQVYTIEGTIDKMAQSINFGGLYYHKGIFFFDDFHFSILNRSGMWEEVPLAESGFESYPDVIDQHWHYFTNPSPFVPSLSGENVYKGRRSLRIDGNLSTPTRLYGSNDSAGKYAGVNGIRLYYEEYGKGAPLLLLHGNRGSIADFSKQIGEFSERFRVIAVDSRGQGASSENGLPYSYQLFAEDINALLGSLHLDSVYILGWGDGGNTGLIMAMKYPKKVKKLAVMGANIFVDETVVDKAYLKNLAEQKEEEKGDSSVRARNELRLIHLLETEPRLQFAQLERITCPVLVMAGEKDDIKELHTRDIATHIPHHQLMIFPGGTHYVPVENPGPFNKLVADFFLVTNN